MAACFPRQIAAGAACYWNAAPTLLSLGGRLPLGRGICCASSSSLGRAEGWRRDGLRFPSALTDRRLRRGLATGNGEVPQRQETGVPSKAPENAAAHNNHNKTSSVAQSTDTARTTSKVISEKVRSSLTNLSPRENIYNLPNFLTVSRLIAAPVTAYLLLHDHHQWALGLFAYAGITDLVDGWLARRWKLQTVAGSVIDPMADKALMIILTVTLAVKGALPLYLATLILGRDAALAIAAFYYRFASLPSPKTFMRYWDFSLPSAEVHPTTVSKYNTFLQLILIGSALALPVLTASPTSLAQLQSFGLDIPALHAAMTYFQYVVAATTAWSGLSYAYLKNAVTILGADEALKAKQGRRGRAIIGLTFGSVVLAALYIAVTVDEEREKAEQRRVGAGAGADEATGS